MVRNDSGEERTASSDICWGKGEKSLFGHIDTTNRAPIWDHFSNSQWCQDADVFDMKVCPHILSLSNAPWHHLNSEDAPGRLNDIFV